VAGSAGLAGILGRGTEIRVAVWWNKVVNRLCWLGCRGLCARCRGTFPPARLVQSLRHVVDSEERCDTGRVEDDHGVPDVRDLGRAPVDLTTAQKSRPPKHAARWLGHAGTLHRRAVRPQPHAERRAPWRPADPEGRASRPGLGVSAVLHDARVVDDSTDQHTR